MIASMPACRDCGHPVEEHEDVTADLHPDTATVWVCHADAGCRCSRQPLPLSTNETLQGLETQTRADYERNVADGQNPQATAIRSTEAGGVWFIVEYSPVVNWIYRFATHAGLVLQGAFDSRESCLSALMARGAK